MRGHTFKYIFENKRSYLGESYYIFDLIGRKVKVLEMPYNMPIDKDFVLKEKNWAIRKYKMGVLFELKVSYEDDPTTWEYFYFWAKDMPIPYSHYSSSRGMLAYYVLWLFNIQFPNMFVFSMRENRMIITDKPYLRKFSRMAVSDLTKETKLKSLKRLNDMV